MRIILLMASALAIAALVPGARTFAADAATPDSIITTDGATVRGRVLGIAAAGTIKMEGGGVVSEVSILAAKRVNLNAGREFPPDYVKVFITFHLADGSRITASIKEWRDEAVVVENGYCSATIARRAIVSIAFGPFQFMPLPRNEGPDDVIVIADRPDVKVKCKILSVSDSEARFKIGETEHSAPLFYVVAVAPAAPDAPPRPDAGGWYASVRMANGDHLVGAVEGMDEDSLRLVTRHAGAIAVKRAAVNGMNFSTSALFSAGEFLVTDPSGGRVALFSSDGAMIWQYNGACAGSDAAALPDGTFLIVSDFADSIKLLTPNGKEARTVKPALKRIETVALLENGNYLAAEGTGGRLVEITPEGHFAREFFNGQIQAGPVVRAMPGGEVLLVDGTNRVSRWSLAEKKLTWSITVEGVLGAADMGQGEVAVAAKDALILFDKDGKEKWRVQAQYPKYRRVGICVTADGTIVIPVTRWWMDEQGKGYKTCLAEYSPDGRKLRETPLQGNGFPVSSLHQD